MRLTNEWTDTLEQAYGDRGTQGSLGERWLTSVLRSHNHTVLLFENDYDMQMRGVDLLVDGRIGIDVKNNLKSGAFFVECSSTGWLYHPNKTSETICHVNPDTGQTVWYNRSDMQEHLRNYRRDLCKVRVDSLPPFCTYEVFS